MSIATQSIRSILSSQPSAAAVFERFEIDPCAHAEETLTQACTSLHLSTDQLVEKLADAIASGQHPAPVYVEDYPPGRLIQHIVRTHHSYVRQELPRLSAMAQKLAGRHTVRAFELEPAAALIQDLRTEMFAHLEKEEGVLFPFIVRMEEELDWSAPGACTWFRTVAQPISKMMAEHVSAEDLVAQLRCVMHGFDPSPDACPTESALHAGLRLFADNLRQHVHLENDILFPRAIEMEAKLQQRR